MVVAEGSLMLRDLEERGFAIVPQVATPAQVEALIAAIERLQRTLAADQSVYGIRHLLRLPEVCAFANALEMSRLIKQVLGPSAFPVRGIFFDKTPEANWKVAWHQDLTITVQQKIEVEGFSAWSRKEEVWHVQPPAETLENMLTARLHLDDCDETNGPLQVLPGSHRAGRLNAQQIDTLRKSTPPFVCAAALGDVLLMRPLLLHASSPATVAKHRRVVHLEFAATDLPSGLQWQAH